jgi:hypothetical protein
MRHYPPCIKPSCFVMPLPLPSLLDLFMLLILAVPYNPLL